ncbi:hypothetical protein [Acidovorax sp. SUPP1855]|uniref:DUF6980 family protein n=1 Tax=Acidovorax sp. SUPP1855 TaxID=431774 RepID=UPI0024E13C0F|nr:hypothetical protein [Acidovorax sp. SUPP1855]
MKSHVLSGDLSLEFFPKFREYGILYRNGGSYQLVTFCPWCGKKLPNSLRDIWFETIEQMGLDPEDDIPEEMQSEVWWLNDNYEDKRNDGLSAERPGRDEI